MLRSDLSGNPGFRALLGRVRQVSLGAARHDELPFEKLVEELGVERSLGHSPLFTVMLVLQNAPPARLELPGLALERLDAGVRAAKFDLTLDLAERPDGELAGTIEYNVDLFDAATVERAAGHLARLLGGVAADPERTLGELPLLTGAERHQVVREWNATAAPGLDEGCLHEHIEAQADCAPDAVALVFEGETLTYRELDRRANQLAHHLRRLGVGPEGLVGVAMERSLELVVGLLGVLKAGAAYLPLDPAYPVDRLAYMIEDAGVPVLLTQERLLGGLPAWTGRVLCLDSQWEAVAAESDARPRSGVAPENLAYVIYTSGSTGRPKGSMLAHRGIVNRLRWIQAKDPLEAGEGVLQKTPASFDVSVWEFFWPLIAGARLVLARPGGHQDSGYLAGLIAQERITTAHFVPSMLQVFLEEPRLGECGNLRRVIASGEALPLELAQRFAARLGAALHNLYGPTEASVEVTAWRCGSESYRGGVPIGRPIANVRIHLLDRGGAPVPVGVPASCTSVASGSRAAICGGPA